MKFGKHIVANPGAEFAEVQICDATWDSLGGTTILPDYLSAQDLRELVRSATDAADLLEQTKGAKGGGVVTFHRTIRAMRQFQEAAGQLAFPPDIVSPGDVGAEKAGYR